MIPLKSPLPHLQVRLDWKTYFEKFQEEHGQPLEYKGRLLFADGWQYSASDYAGPEWPPPTDERALRLMQRTYWFIRRRLAANELYVLQGQYSGLRSLQGAKSIKLQNSFISVDHETKKLNKTVEDLDFAMFEGRIAWLEMDLRESDQHLNELKECNASA